MKNNLSPEELLRSKEMEGGLDYDKPIEEVNPLIERIENHKSLGNVNQTSQTIEPHLNKTPLGKVDNRIRRTGDNLETGWKNLPLDMLPSSGRYYPEGAQIAIRPADVVEIRHFSTIDEDDKISMTSQLNYILDRCMRMQFPREGVVDYLDLIQEDRFYIIVAIRDLTFLKGENKILLRPSKKCKSESECPFVNGFELRTGCLDFFKISERIMKYYSPANRRFEFRLRENPDDLIVMNMPTIGTKEIIDQFFKKMDSRKIEIDPSFKDILPFILPDRKNLNSDVIYQKYRESDYWTKEEFSLYFMLAKELKIGTKLEASLICPNCNQEIKARILFKDGIKSIFVISDILGQLL